MYHALIKVLLAAAAFHIASATWATEDRDLTNSSQSRPCGENDRCTRDLEDQVALLQTSIQTHGRSNSSKVPYLRFPDRFYRHTKVRFSFNGKSSAAGQKLDSSSRQMRIWSTLSILVALTMALFVFVAKLDDEQPEYPAYFLALTSCIGFGIDNFINAYAASYLHEPASHVIMVFFFDGIGAAIGHLIMTQISDTYEKAWEETIGSTRALTFTFLTAVLIVAGMFCSNIGFSLDQSDSGPHQALVCGDVLVVSPFFYVMNGEVLTKVQLCGCVLIIVGMLWMSNAFAKPTKNETFSFAWLFLSMLCYAGSIVTWRSVSTGDEKVHWQPRVFLIFGFMGVLGILFSSASLAQGGLTSEYYENPILLAWPMLDCVASLVGMCAVNLAYEKVAAATGAITAVVDANSVVLLILNIALVGMTPSNTQLAGMIIVLTGCSVVCSGDMYEGDELNPLRTPRTTPTNSPESTPRRPDDIGAESSDAAGGKQKQKENSPRTDGEGDAGAGRPSPLQK